MSSANKTDRSQRALLELVTKPGNEKCADCKARNPRWASHNLGIFICMNCASIHRKIGTHITKVKSLTMDSWTREQVEHMRQNGNDKSNAHYNPNEVRHPPPANLMDAERDSEMEQYIRSKYERKRFIDNSPSVASEPGPSRSIAPKTQPSRSQTVSALGPSSSTTSRPALASSSTREPVAAAARPLVGVTKPPPARSATQPLSSQPLSPAKPSNNPVWDDLISLQAPAQTSSLPLQLLAQPSGVPNTQPYLPTNQIGPPNPFTQMNATGAGMGMGMGVNTTGLPGINPFQQMQQQPNFNPNPQQPLPPGGTNPFYFSPQPQPPPQQSQQLLPSFVGGTPSPFGGQQSSSPYGQHQTPSPFGQQQNPSPFGQQQNPSPFGQQQNPSPFGQQQTLSPYVQQPAPYGQQILSPFGQQPSPIGQQNPSPFGQRPSPIGQQNPSPFGQQPSPIGQQNPLPFGQQPSPFGQQPSPFGQQPPPFGQQPSSFGQQSQQQMFTQQGNPFPAGGGWPQGQQGGFQGQQWSGM